MGTLAQYSQINSPSGRGRDALKLLLARNRFFSALERNDGWVLKSQSDTYRPVLETNSAPARAIGGDFTADNRAPAALQALSLAIHGGHVKTDATYIRDAANKTGGIDEWLSESVAEEFGAFADALEKKFMNGNAGATPPEIKGLSKILTGTDDLPGFTGQKRVTNAKRTGDSLSVADAAGQKILLETMRNCLADVQGCNVILMDPSLHARLETAAFDRHTATGTDQFGVAITTFSGVEIVPLVKGSIPLDEPDDATPTAGTNTTSIYFLALGAGRCQVATNSGLAYNDWVQSDNGAHSLERWEVSCQWLIKRADSVLRLRNIKL